MSAGICVSACGILRGSKDCNDHEIHDLAYEAFSMVRPAGGPKNSVRMTLNEASSLYPNSSSSSIHGS